MRNEWGEDQNTLLIENYALHGWQWVQAELITRFGVKRTQKSIQAQASRMKACRAIYGTWYTVSELSTMLQLPEATIKRAIYKKKVLCRKSNGAWLLSESAIAYFNQAYPPIPEGYIPSAEAAKQIGVTKHALIRAIERGSVEYIARGRFYYVRQAFITQIVEELKETGKIRVMWEKVRRNDPSRWPSEHEVLLKTYYTEKGWTWVQAELKARFGASYTEKAIHHKASKLDICHKLPDGWHSVYEIVEATQAPHQSVIWAIKHHEGLVTRKVNRLWQVDQSSYETLVDHFTQPEGYIRSVDAAHLIGVSENSITAAAKKGYIDSQKKGRYRYVRLEDIQRGIDYLKETANVQTSWKFLKEREKAC